MQHVTVGVAMCNKCSKPIESIYITRMNLRHGKHLDLCPNCYSSLMVEDISHLDFI